MNGHSCLAVSVVIPTCGRPELLERCVNALSAQTLGAARYEIIVVDDGRSTATREAVHRLSVRPGMPRVLYMRPSEGHFGPAAARNAGWSVALADIVAFTDDDTIPARGWLEAGLRAFRDDVVAVAGAVQVPLPPNPTDWERNTAGLATAEFVTANCFVKRDALAAVGGFDERFRRPWREDSDLQFALIERGLRIARAHDALVLHPPRPAPWGVSLKIQRNMYFDALLFKKHPVLYRSKIASRPPLRYYAVLGAAAIGAAGAAAGHPALAVGGGAAWLAWTAWFCAQRLRHTQRSARHILEMAVTSALIPATAVFWRIAGAVHFQVAFA